MTLSEFGGVFSRYFVIGFFAPAFFAAALLSQLLDQDFFPSSYQLASPAAQLAVLGAVALLIGLILSGLHYHVTRLFEGYPLSRLRGNKLVARIHNRLLLRWEREFDGRTGALSGEPSSDRTRAALELNRCFPARRTDLLPTRFGNAVRSFETHGRVRYGLDGISAWPRISLLLSDSERDQVTDAQTDVAMFLNLGLVVLGSVATLTVDRIWHEPTVPAAVAQIGIAWAVGLGAYWGCYRAATAAAMRWGSPIRAAYDMHRLDFYNGLGLIEPQTQSEEEAVARAANRLLLFGEPIPDGLRRNGAKEAT